MANGSLTDKQQAFIDAYLGCLNATEAARQAGYQGSDGTLGVVGHENLRKPKIRAAIDARLQEYTMHANEVLYRLHQQACGIPEDCFVAYDRIVGINFEKLKEYGLMHLIKKISYDRYGNPTVEFYDAQNALVQLGKHHALFTERYQRDDWRSEAIEYIRKGELSYEALVEAFDHDLATELFATAGVPVTVRAGAAKV